MSSRPPRVFISYSHDDEAHRGRVLALANQLRADGIDAWLDRYEQAPREGWPRWMERQLREADFVVVVCTQTYRRRFDGLEEPGKGRGVTWEGLLATQLLYEEGTLNRKLVPVLFGGMTDDAVPLPLKPFTRFRLPDQYPALYHLLARQPEVTAPLLGERREPLARDELPSLAEPPARSEGLPPPEGDPRILAGLTTEIANLRRTIERATAEASSARETSSLGPLPLLQRRRHGRRLAVVVFAAALLSAFVAWNWGELRGAPAGALIERLVRLPSPVPGFFNIGIARLANDEDGEQRRKIESALRDLEGIRVSASPREIALSGAQLQEALSNGHAEAERYLNDSGFDALIWGEVLGTGGDAALKLYWTTAPGVRRSTEAFNFEPNQTLPSLFWSEMADVLRLVVTTSAAAFSEREGEYVGDQLAPFVDRVRKLLSSESVRAGLEIGELQTILAYALTMLATQTGQDSLLREAVDLNRKTLGGLSRERAPLDWAATQNSLGNALSVFGERESDTAPLEEAVFVYRNALQERTRARVPLEWAETQNNLGSALSRLGQREPDAGRLEESVASFRYALEEYTAERVPLRWAAVQANLGAALQLLGKREFGAARLEEAVAAYGNALQVRTRDRAPLDWARTQTNLGGALTALGERAAGTELLEDAIEAHRLALQELTRERVPLDWAIAQNNLGGALSTLGERESDTALLEEAVAVHRDALQVRTRERAPLDWATTQNNLGIALQALGELESGAARLEEAAAAYRDALRERTRERVPLDWARTQHNLGNALQMIGDREPGTARLEEAVAAYRDALQERTLVRVPLEWATTQNNLGHALAMLGERESGTARLEEAVRAYRSALMVFSEEHPGHYRELAIRNLESAERLIEDRSPAE